MTVPSIFIVEDEIITAKSIAENIKLLGYRVAGIATNSSKAIAQILELRPDLILMDILLKKSDLDGISTAAKIKEQVNIPIVYITAHSDEETLERAKVTTPFGYILKPYTKKDLEISLKMALYKHDRELELLKRERLYSNILNSTQVGVIATDNDSLITYINPAAQKFTGWQTAEALQQKASEVVRFIDARTNEPIPHPVEQVLEQGNVVYLDEHTVLIAKDGSQIPIRDSVSPILEQSQANGAVLIFAPARESLTMDTTSTRDGQIETQITPIIKTQLNKLSCDLLDIVVHELRTPLTIILSTSESLRLYRQRWTTKKQNSSFDKIQRAVGQMTRLLDNISIWEQVEANRISFQPELIDVVSLCEELLSDLRLIDGDRHKILFTYKQVKNRMAYLDPALFRYTLNNLFLNAIKYSASDSTIYLTLERQENHIVLKVRDEGIGIPPQEQPYLFESFYRADNVGDIPGTGLGLAIALMCLEIQQGTISLESEVGVGTTFTVTLPV